MLRKLMKYEVMATARVYLPIFAALLLLSIANNIFGKLGLGAPAIIGVVVSVILMVGICVITLILTLQRFWSNLLTNEGYLMMTLPVSADKLILGKLFVSALWGFASLFVVIISIMVMAVTEIEFSSLVSNMGTLFGRMPITLLDGVVYTIEIFLIVTLGAFACVLLLYACMALSMVFNKRRMLVAFGFFVAMTTLLQIIVVCFIFVVGVMNAANVFGFFNASSFAQNQIMMLSIIAIEAAICAAFYFITRYMLINRLNLQ